MADPLLSPVLVAVTRYRKALEKLNDGAVTRLLNAYGDLWVRLQAQLRGIQDAIDAGQDQTYLRDRIIELSQQVEVEVARYAQYADQELSYSARQAIQAALEHAPRLVATTYGVHGPEVIRTMWNYLPTDAVENLLGMFGPSSPLYQKMSASLGPTVADQVGQAMMEALAMGQGIDAMKRAMEERFNTKLWEGYTWSYGTAQTATIWAYREATRASYLANSRLVTGWRWASALDSRRTCLSCLAMHGTFHRNDEVLNDHRNGLCAMVPVTKSWAELGLEGVPEADQTIQPGPEWFARQPEDVQLQMMGPANFTAWKAGQADFPDFVAHYADDVHGEMLVEASLKGIAGERAQQYYQQAA